MASDDEEDISADVSDSTHASVDTGVDSDGDHVPDPAKTKAAATGAPTIGDALARPDVEFSEPSEGEDADVSGDDMVEAGAREDALPGRKHPPGTWKVWENKWFYITQTPGWIDAKIWMRNSFRNDFGGMGTQFMSKTLRPHHFDEPLYEPARTLLLLRAWAIWRAKWGGWARQEPSRLREVDLQLHQLEMDIRSIHSAEPGAALAVPLLGTQAAHDRLAEFVPAVVFRLVAA